MSTAPGQDLARWPAEIIEQAVSRNLLVVIGSGISRTAENARGDVPPTWSELLESLVVPAGAEAQADSITELVEQGRLLDAAELIRHVAKAQGRTQTINQHVRNAVDGRAPVNFTGSDWHSAIVRLEPRVIATTNYDNIIERATNSGYAMHDYTSSAAAGDVRRGVPTLIKVHGTVDKIEEIVLTRSDYTKLKVVGRQVIELLHALLLTRPALFIGYSLRDPDIQLILENVMGAREETPAHYLLAEDSIPEYEREVLRYCYGVALVTYEAGNHTDAFNLLQALADEVQGSRLSA